MKGSLTRVARMTQSLFVGIWRVVVLAAGEGAAGEGAAGEGVAGEGAAGEGAVGEEPGTFFIVSFVSFTLYF